MSKCNELERAGVEKVELKSEVAELQTTLSAKEVERLKVEVQSQTAKVKWFWRMRCEHMLQNRSKEA